jgi:putative protease
VFLPLWQIDAPAVDERMGVYIPPVVTDSEMSGIKELLLSARERGYKWALVGNIGQISLARELGFSVFGDFRLNVTNSLSAVAYEKMGVEGLVLSPEITLPMARDIGGYEICYGRIPLMLLERCYMKESFGCDRCDKCALTDRTGAAFPLMREYGHRNLLLNSAVTYMGDRRAELDSYRINGEHFIFSVEKPDEVIKVMRAYARGEAMPLSCQVRRIGKR